MDLLSRVAQDHADEREPSMSRSSSIGSEREMSFLEFLASQDDEHDEQNDGKEARSSSPRPPSASTSESLSSSLSQSSRKASSGALSSFAIAPMPRMYCFVADATGSIHKYASKL
jgi:hypothetical protein